MPSEFGILFERNLSNFSCLACKLKMNGPRFLLAYTNRNSNSNHHQQRSPAATIAIVIANFDYLSEIFNFILSQTHTHMHDAWFHSTKRFIQSIYTFLFETLNEIEIFLRIFNNLEFIGWIFRKVNCRSRMKCVLMHAINTKIQTA